MHAYSARSGRMIGCHHGPGVHSHSGILNHSIYRALGGCLADMSSQCEMESRYRSRSSDMRFRVTSDVPCLQPELRPCIRNPRGTYSGPEWTLPMYWPEHVWPVVWRVDTKKAMGIAAEPRSVPVLLRLSAVAKRGALPCDSKSCRQPSPQATVLTLYRYQIAQLRHLFIGHGRGAIHECHASLATRGYPDCRSQVGAHYQG